MTEVKKQRFHAPLTDLIVEIVTGKRVLKLFKPFSGPCLTVKSQNLPQIRSQVVHLRPSGSYIQPTTFGHAHITKFGFCYKSDTAVLTFSFRFLSSPLLLLFLTQFCCWTFSFSFSPPPSPLPLHTHTHTKKINRGSCKLPLETLSKGDSDTYQAISEVDGPFLFLKFSSLYLNIMNVMKWNENFI